jgi:hypothetical protein
LLTFLTSLGHSLLHYDIVRNIRKAKMKKKLKIPKDMPILCVVAKKWKVVVLGE